ncbi:hypothetical protein RDWZM_008355 [Blomia tropicalis]|uniref:Uncharacterized protein n=1 Tax=Blomia tropicalis TaxID=40697 RepID=A0A9Q0M1X6_BLOTA|nr:hypothetical protein RDWZM_008355 [Blomia tropicalis]
MPLIIGNHSEPIDPDHDFASFDTLFSNFPNLAASTFNIFDGETTPNSYDCERNPVLYIMQGEMAIVSPQDETIKFILTDDTTTCISGVIRHCRSGLTCLAHFDQPLDIFSDSLDTLLEKMNRLGLSLPKIEANKRSSNVIDHSDPFNEIDFELYLIGGYCDEMKTSEKLTTFLLTRFHQVVHYQINLVCAFIGPLNTKSIHIADSLRIPGGANIPAPKVYGVAVDVCNGTIINATLNRKSNSDLSNVIPMYDIRRASVSFSSEKKLREIYDPERRLLTIEPVSFYQVNSAEALIYFNYALRLRDQDILKKFSTSPYVEPDHFVQDTRNNFQFFLNNRHRNIRRMYFSNDQPRRFRHYRLLCQLDNFNKPGNSSQQSSSSVQYRWKEFTAIN